MPPLEMSWLIRFWMFCPASAASAPAGMLNNWKLLGICSPMLRVRLLVISYTCTSSMTCGRESPSPSMMPGRGVQNIALRPDHNRAGARLRSHQPDFKKIAQHVDESVQFLRRAHAGQIESAQRHAIKLAVILRRFRRQQNLLAIERRPEGVGHLAGGRPWRCKSRRRPCRSEPGARPRIRQRWRSRRTPKPPGSAVRGHRRDSENQPGPCSGTTRSSSASATTCGADCGFRRPLSHRVLQTLLGKFILRIQMQRGAELGQRFDLAAVAHFRIAPLQMIEDQLLAGHFPRRHVLHIFGRQPRRRLKLVEGLVLPLFPLQLQSLGERFARFFYFFFGWIAGDSPGRAFRTRQERCAGRLVAGTRRPIPMSAG